VQRGATVAKTGDTSTVKQVRVNASDLWRGVDPEPQSAPRQLIDHLEGLQIERTASARQKRFNVLYQRRDDKLVAKDTRSV
jgi:hypothetical protein